MNFTRRECHTVTAVPYRIQFELSSIPGVSVDERDGLLCVVVRRRGEKKILAQGNANYEGQGWKYDVRLGAQFADCPEGEYEIAVIRDGVVCDCLYFELLSECHIIEQSGDVAKEVEYCGKS